MATKNESKKPTDETLHKTKAHKTFKAKADRYGFLHFGKPLRKAWGISKGAEQAVTIEIVESNLVVKKV